MQKPNFAPNWFILFTEVANAAASRKHLISSELNLNLDDENK